MNKNKTVEVTLMNGMSCTSVLKNKLDDAFQDFTSSVQTFVPVAVDEVLSYKEIGQRNFLPVYQFVVMKEGKKIGLRIGCEEMTDKALKFFIDVSKPDFKNKGKWKFLFTSYCYDLINIGTTIIKLK